MANTAFGPYLSLSPDQEDLLRTALASNPPGSPQSASKPVNGVNRFEGSPVANPNLYTSPGQTLDGQLSDSPLFDDLNDCHFDWDEPLFGDLGDYDENGELHDKRKASTGSDEGDNKRQQGDSKAPKKPGRKLLTAEPTTKRKAQNRAAQRAFRERKERHLKDLETKVDDLEKASEATNHENGRLRAQVEKLTVELKEYRKRLSLTSTGASHSPPLSAQSRASYDSNNDFSYAFPKFGDLPGSFMNGVSLARTSTARTQSTAGQVRRTTSGNTISSPTAADPFILPQTTASPLQQFNDAGLSQLTGLFSPSILETASRSNSADYNVPSGGPSSTSSVRNASFSKPQIQHRGSSSSTCNSPASSMRFDSSVGTTPESTGESPLEASKSDPVLNTIKEENAPEDKRKLSAALASTCGDASNPVPPKLSGIQTSSSNHNGIDWMAQQNGGTFEPVLFGDYRDPQDNIVNNISDDFFTDAFGVQDFVSPYNTGNDLPGATPEPKHDLMQEIEITQNGDQDEKVGEKEGKVIGCDGLWDRVQSSEKYQSGEETIDSLCSELKAKAKCSGGAKGAVIEEKEVDRILGPKSTTQKKSGKGVDSMWGAFI